MAILLTDITSRNVWTFSSFANKWRLHDCNKPDSSIITEYRNFSEWMHNAHFSLSRVNYGVNFRQSNFTGNNDKLVVGLITGYTHQLILRYQFPYIDKSLKWGVGAGLSKFLRSEPIVLSVKQLQSPSKCLSPPRSPIQLITPRLPLKDRSSPKLSKSHFNSKQVS